jgi:hypothetical protein
MRRMRGRKVWRCAKRKAQNGGGGAGKRDLCFAQAQRAFPTHSAVQDSSSAWVPRNSGQDTARKKKERGEDIMTISSTWKEYLRYNGDVGVNCRKKERKKELTRVGCQANYATFCFHIAR